MKKPNNWENVQASREFTPLPAGGYICKIMGAKVKEYNSNGSSFERLEIALDITEGAFKDFYKQDFENQNTEDKKWKGVLRLYVPKDDGSEKDEWTKSRLKATTDAIEDSNSGFHWDWDESKLKNKIVGCIFRNEEWEFNGKTGIKAQPFKFISTDLVREGKFKIPEDKLLKNKSAVSGINNSANYVEIESDDDLPF